eukprot:1188061-Prorocentrum_minimum.AAC.1
MRGGSLGGRLALHSEYWKVDRPEQRGEGLYSGAGVFGFAKKSNPKGFGGRSEGCIGPRRDRRRVGAARKGVGGGPVGMTPSNTAVATNLLRDPGALFRWARQTEALQEDIWALLAP